MSQVKNIEELAHYHLMEFHPAVTKSYLNSSYYHDHTPVELLGTLIRYKICTHDLDGIYPMQNSGRKVGDEYPCPLCTKPLKIIEVMSPFSFKTTGCPCHTSGGPEEDHPF